MSTIQYKMNLYEVLVPTQYGDTLKPISTRHHKNWDKVIRKIAGGLTILSPARGQWIHVVNDGEQLIEERVIPVRIACDPAQIEKIVAFTLTHYRQNSVMYYLLTNEAYITFA